MSTSTRLRAALLLALGAPLAACNDEDLREVLGLEPYFVKLEKEPAEVAETVNALADEFGFEPLHVYDSATQGFAVWLHPEVAKEVERLPEVEYVKRDQKDREVPPEEEAPPDDEIVEDPAPELGEGEIPPSVERIGGPFLGSADYTDCQVAVIDTGIDASHPDLNVVASYDVVGESTPRNAAPNADPNGHGTHVAGTIGALANGEGVVGVAPGVPLHAIRVLDGDGAGYTTDIVAGLEYVLDHPEICVVNMSLGGPAWSGEDPMADAVRRLEDRGVVVVMAAGNESDDTVNYTPAGYDLGIVVSAYDTHRGDNGFAWFSNFGDAVDVAAPGVKVMSTWPGGSYAKLDGTSMASPAVAGVAVVYRALNPGDAPSQVRRQLVSAGENGYPGQNNKHPEPLVDLAALLP